jgi:putative transposase
MLRVARLDTPGLFHHIMIRGIERRRIFNDDKDRVNFIERLSILVPETKTQCYAWVFMPNHGHFLFRSGPSGISTLMRRLLTGYAVSYNPAGSGISFSKTDINPSFARKTHICRNWFGIFI